MATISEMSNICDYFDWVSTRAGAQAQYKGLHEVVAWPAHKYREFEYVRMVD